MNNSKTSSSAKGYRFGVARFVEKVIGRRNLVRLSRFFLDFSRRDLPNEFSINGEQLVQQIVGSLQQLSDLVVFDVGANVGTWSSGLVRAVQPNRQSDLHLFAFEPSRETYSKLLQNLEGFTNRFQIVTERLALSNLRGASILYKTHELAGTNSIDGFVGSKEGLVPEDISLETLDEYCKSRQIARIDFLKIDTEGHDFLVLKGAENLINVGAIRMIQFEYNYRWIGSRHYLKDAFSLLEQNGYRIGKITPAAIEWYASWSPELETFREANYLAVQAELVDAFPSLTWWAQ